jgi:putative transposase
VQYEGQRAYLYRAVDKANQTVDFFLSPTRDAKAAQAFFDKAIGSSGKPEKVNVDKSGANLAINEGLDEKQKIIIRQVKYLNNGVEQDHRGIKRLTKPMMGFKDFVSATATLAGIELCHMIRKGQHVLSETLSTWKQFYALAG